MPRVLLIVLFAMLPATGSAQGAADREAVLKTIQIFFDTMTARDVEGARRIMAPEGRFYAMEMRKPKSEPESFTNEEYFARLQKSKQTAANGSGIRKCACMDWSRRCGRRTTSGPTASSVTAAWMPST